MTAIKRLRELEKRMRDEAGQHEINALEADSVGATAVAVAQEWKSDLKCEIADELATLIAELGQEVGAVAVPEGWALVPIEPTWDMRNEGREFLIDGIEKEPERLAYFLWKTMISAAPERF